MIASAGGITDYAAHTPFYGHFSR